MWGGEAERGGLAGATASTIRDGLRTGRGYALSGAGGARGTEGFLGYAGPCHAAGVSAQAARMAEFRVFLSTVSSEFADARDALARDLLARGIEVRWQEMFRQEKASETLLGLLHDYVRDCQAVVCVLGQRSGACPPPKAAESIRLGRTGCSRGMGGLTRACCCPIVMSTKVGMTG